jgi:hypothetical protein
MKSYMIVDIEKSIGDFIKFMDAAKASNEYCEGELNRVLSLLQDLVHDAELGENKSRTEANRFYREMRDARKLRRKLLNEQEQLKPVLAWIEQNNQVKGSLSKLQGAVRTISSAQGLRKYGKRTGD